MNLEKIQSLAKNLSSLIPNDVNSLYEVYIWGISIRKKYSEYFKKMSVPDFLKLIVSIWSYKTTGDFKLSRTIFDKLFFVYFFDTDLDAYVYECDECDGSGELSCSNCDYGQIDCDECTGGGDVRCDDCDGSGIISDDEGEDHECENCSGSGYVTCEECGGGGQTTCDNCNGSSRESCGNCDGSGEIESDNLVVYTKRVYLSWNQELKDIAELKLNSPEGIDYSEFERLVKKDSVLLSEDEDHGTFNEDVLSDKYYIFDINDDASDLYFGSSNFIKMSNSPDHYLS